jgi:3-methyladenine DNA glycosylase Tag
VRNAGAFLKIQEAFGSFDSYCWRFVDGRPRLNRWKRMRQIPATSLESDAFNKDLKSRGFSFVGAGSQSQAWAVEFHRFGAGSARRAPLPTGLRPGPPAAAK